jgi:WD40 repeat protein
VVRVALVGAGRFDDCVRDEGDPTANQGFSQLPFIGTALSGLAAAFGRLEGITVAPVLLDPTKERFEEFWRELLAWPRDEPVILCFAGHGLRMGSTLYLPVRDSQSGRLPSTSIHINSYIDEVEHTPHAPSVLFMLDVCGGGQAAAHQLVQGIREQERRAWVIAACAEDEKTYGARFTQATARALDLLRKGYWDLSPAVGDIPLETVARQISREMTRMDDGQGYAPTVVHSPKRLAASTPPPFFANPAHSPEPIRRLERRLDAALIDLATDFDVAFDLEHFLGKAAGSVSGGAGLFSCFFTGRHRELAQIRDWLDGDEPLLVVTGEPGAGKSALLGVTVWLAHPGLQALSAPVVSRVPLELHPRRRYPTLVGVHARQRTAEQIVDSIHAQLDRYVDPVDESQSDDPVEHLIKRAKGLPEPVIVVLDAIDESLDGQTLADQVLARLRLAKRSDGRSAFRVLAAVRPWWDQYGSLAQSAGDALLDLDLGELADAAATAAQAEDFARYFSHVLALSPAYSDTGARESVAQAVGAELASGHYGGGHLLATLYARHLSVGQPLDAATAVARIPRDLPAMFDLQLETLEATQPWLRLVMTAVAGGLGRGMPLDLVHAATKAYIPDDSADAPTLGEVRGVLESAAFYLRTQVDTDGSRLYHFFHQSLTDHFLNDSLSPRLFAQLMAAVPQEKGPHGPVYWWDDALPYLQAHVLDHAALTGDHAAVDRLLLDARFLLVAVEGTLERVPLARCRTARRAAAALKRQLFLGYRVLLGHRLGDIRALEWSLVQRGGRMLARHLNAVAGSETESEISSEPGSQSTALSLRWATSEEPTALVSVLDELGAEPTVVAIADGDDEAVALVGGADGSVQVWEALHGESRRRHLLADVHQGGVEYLVVVDVDDEAKVVTYGNDRLAAIIDVATGRLQAQAPLPGARITAMAPAGELGPSVFLAGHADGMISVFAVTGDGFEQLGLHQSGGHAAVTSLACMGALDAPDSVRLSCLSDDEHSEDYPADRRWLQVLDDRPVIIDAGWNGSVRISDKDGLLLHRLESYDGNTKWVPATGDFIRVLDAIGPETGRVLEWLRRHTSDETEQIPRPVVRRGLTAVDLRRIGDVRLALTAHADGHIRVWDLDLACCPAMPGQVISLFTGRLSERKVVAAVSRLPTAIKVWDLETGAETAELLIPEKIILAAVAVVDGEILVLTATPQGELKLDDVAGRYRLGSIVPELSVTAVGLGADDRGALVAVGGAEGDIRLWRVTDDRWHPMGSLSGIGRQVTGLAFVGGDSPTVLLAVFANAEVRSWSLDDLTAPAAALLTDDPGRTVLACGTGPSSQLVVTRHTDGRIEVWDSAQGNLAGCVDSEPETVTMAAVAVASGELRLLTIDSEGRALHVWDVVTGRPVGRPTLFPASFVPSQIAACDGEAIVAFRHDVAAFDWTDPTERDLQTAVKLSHVLSWFPGEILASDPDADAWDLQTWEAWIEGEPPDWRKSIPSAGVKLPADLLWHHVAHTLESEGFDVVALEPDEYEISVPDGQVSHDWVLPLYYVFTHHERPVHDGADQ